MGGFRVTAQGVGPRGLWDRVSVYSVSKMCGAGRGGGGGQEASALEDV